MSYRNALLIRENKRKYIFFVLFTLFNIGMVSGTTWEDEFSGELKSEWFWIRENVSAWTMYPTYLQMNMTDTDMYETTNTAPLLLRNWTGNFSIQTNLSVDLLNMYEGAGIIVYLNDSNYIRLMYYNSSIHTNYILSAKEENNVFTYHVIEYNANPIYLKINKTENNYSFYYKNNINSAWTKTVNNYTLNYTTTDIGIITAGAGSGSQIPAKYDYFKVEYFEPLTPIILSGYVKNTLDLGIYNGRIDINGNYSFSDENGYFSISTFNGTQDLLCRAIGYQNYTKNIVVYGNYSINITLNERTYSSSDEVSEAGIMGLIGGIFGGIMAFTLIKKYIRR